MKSILTSTQQQQAKMGGWTARIWIY